MCTGDPAGVRLQEKRWGTDKQMREGVEVDLSEMGPWEEMGTLERKLSLCISDEYENEGLRFLD